MAGNAVSEVRPRKARRVLLVGWRSASAMALNDFDVALTTVVSVHDFTTAVESGVVSHVIPVDSPHDVEEVLAALARVGLTPHDFAFVCSGSEFSLVAASVIGAVGGARALGVPTSILLRDKFAQKRAIRDRGIVTADCYVLQPGSSEMPADFAHGGVVVKPIAGAGATDTRRFTTQAEFAEWRASPAARVLRLVESYVDGWEVQIDGVVREGTVRALVVSKYLQNMIDVHAGGLVGAIVVKADQHPALYSSARELVSRALDGLGHGDGVFHLEAFVNGSELVFGECAGRVSGGMADQVIESMFGVRLHDEWARAVLGEPSHASQTTTSTQTLGDVYLVAPAGTLRHVPTASEIAAQPGVVDVRVAAHDGDVIDVQSATHMRAATVVIAGADADEVEKHMRAIAHWFTTACVTV